VSRTVRNLLTIYLLIHNILINNIRLFEGISFPNQNTLIHNWLCIINISILQHNERDAFLNNNYTSDFIFLLFSGLVIKKQISLEIKLI